MLKPTRWTLRLRRRSTLWWGVGIAGFIALELAFYPTFHDQAESLTKTLETLPPSVKALLGSVDYGSPIGYLGGRVFYLLLPMLLGILAVTLGASLLAREERDGTLELLLARPVSRTKLYLGKLLSGATILGLMCIVALVATLGMDHLVKLDVATKDVALATLAVYALSVCFLTLTYAITAGLRIGRRIAGGLGAMIAFGGYIVSSLASQVDWLKTPSKFLPFTYYKPEEILAGTMHWNNLIYFVGVMLGALLLGWWGFTRRDIGTT